MTQNQNQDQSKWTDKVKEKVDRKKESHMRSVQEGSILDVIYKTVSLLKELILAARDYISSSYESRTKNNGGEN